jgi:thiamine-phosphate diphosphorylase / hydroxyethylthiazole kinase
MPRQRERPVVAGLPGPAKLTVIRKTNTKEIIGPLGARKIREAVKDAGYSIPTVCIGGINHGNIQRVLTESEMILPRVHGAAVVSAIVADADPELAARRLKDLIHNLPMRQIVTPPESWENRSLSLEIWEVVRAIHNKKPVSHNMTNLVLPPHRQCFAEKRC